MVRLVSMKTTAFPFPASWASPHLSRQRSQQKIVRKAGEISPFATAGRRGHSAKGVSRFYGPESPCSQACLRLSTESVPWTFGVVRGGLTGLVKDVTVERNDQIVWEGEVIVWDNADGTHGIRTGSSGPGQWVNGDKIRELRECQRWRASAAERCGCAKRVPWALVGLKGQGGGCPTPCAHLTYSFPLACAFHAVGWRATS